MTLIKKENGAVSFRTEGNCSFILNWANGLMEVHCNKKIIFVIDMNKEEL